MEFRHIFLSLLGPYKFEIFFTFIFFIVPLFLGLMMFSNWFERGLFFLLNFTTHRAPTIENISLSDNTKYFKGTAMNHSIHIGDIFAVLFILLMILKSDYRKYFKLIPPGFIAMLIYAITASLSVINAHPQTVERSWYAVSLHGRQLLFFYALANYFRIPGRKDYQLKSFLFVAIYTFSVALQQRYIMGLYRLGADFVHPNQMVFYLAPIMILFITLFLNHKENSYGKLIPSIGIFSALIPCLMSLSRGVILNLGFGLLFVFLFDFSFRFKIKKLLTVALLFFMMILGTMKAWDTWYWRFVSGSNPMGTAQRKAYYIIGYQVFKNNMMFGLGINQFGSMAYTDVVLDAVIESGILKSDALSQGFVKSLRANRKSAELKGVAEAAALNHGGTPESFYVMHFAETGVVGTLGTLFCQGFFIFTCLSSIFYFRRRNIFLLNLSVGLFGAQIGMYTQSVFEFILRQENPMYLQAIIYALISSVTAVRRSGEYDLKDLDNSPPKEIPLEELPPPVPDFALSSNSSLSNKSQDAGM